MEFHTGIGIDNKQFRTITVGYQVAKINSQPSLDIHLK